MSPFHTANAAKQHPNRIDLFAVAPKLAALEKGDQCFHVSKLGGI
jgi:hypothetical protein